MVRRDCDPQISRITSRPWPALGRSATGNENIFCFFTIAILGTAGAQWLRCCATNRKVAASIPDGVIGFFIDIKSFRSHYGPGIDTASNRNEYQEHFLGVKAAGT